MPEETRLQLHIAVCDDEPSDRLQISEMAQEILQEAGIPCTVSLYPNGAELLEAIQRGVSFHILLLDMMMDTLDGLSLASALRKQGDNTVIIFISSNREMAMRGYEVSAVRYLGKPVQRPQLKEALLFSYQTFYKKRDILLPTSRGQRRIPYFDIIYAEAVNRATKLTLTGNREEMINMKFSDLAAMMPERLFALSHRSYLVNLEYVSYLRNRELELTNGVVLPVSRYRLETLQKRMVDYLSG